MEVTVIAFPVPFIFPSPSHWIYKGIPTNLENVLIKLQLPLGDAVKQWNSMIFQTTFVIDHVIIISCILYYFVQVSLLGEARWFTLDLKQT